MAPEAGLKAMLAHVRDLPAQLEAAPGLPGLADLAPPSVPIRDVLVCGMGGSAIAGDLLAPVAEHAGVRLAVRREADLPGWLDERTLLVFSSYSGRTGETLGAARAAVGLPNPRVAITTGGPLGDLADGAAAPCPRVTLPPGLPPRAALGHGLGALACVLDRVGAVPGLAAQLPAAAAAWRRGEETCGPAAGPDNPALLAARAALGRLLVVYTCSPEAHAPGMRLKAQVNENGKSPALVVALPEAAHNDIVGWEVLRPRRRDFLLLMLHSGDETPEARLRARTVADLLDGEFQARIEHEAAGDFPLARILSLVQFGDYLSCYLAAAAGVDPVPVARIDALKDRMRKDGGT
ncbi:MAG: SIS domain-containing protein [bacterium]|nr:SIS domain-containing protein [bacterium]